MQKKGMMTASEKAGVILWPIMPAKKIYFIYYYLGKVLMPYFDLIFNEIMFANF